MYYLYGAKRAGDKKLVATFDSEQQLLAYVRWATLQENADGTFKFEQGSPLVGSNRWEHSRTSPATDEATDVPHNPTPSML
jgi:hypothetical protein